MPSHILRVLFISFFLSVYSIAEGQFVVKATNDITVLREGGSTFLNPWTGGLNAIQLSKLDADFDGDEDDIFLFDRAGNRTIILIGEDSDGEQTYLYDPFFRTSFPNMRNFSLLRDFDCDGRKDIFTYSLLGGAMAIHRNTSSSQNLSWELTSEAVLSFYDFGSTSYTTNIYTSSQDIPAIFDYDNDGDLDIMSFNVGGTFIELHLNSSVDNSGECGLEYYLANRCYGGFIEGENSNDIVLDPEEVSNECTFNVVDPRTGGLRHIGSTILALDGNDDGLYDLVLGDVGFENLVYLENSSQGEEPDQILDFDPNFPSNMGGDAVSIDNFPAAFYEDVDGDDVSDLIVGVNTSAGAATYESVQLYLNSGSESAPSFSFVTNSFLQNEMLDWGSNASPSVVDYNGDGLMDLVIGCTSYQAGDEPNQPRLILLENTGTPTEPAFQVIDQNWLELSTTFSSSNPSPAFGDFDNDGDQDLVVGFTNGSLHYFEKENGWNYIGLIPTTDGINGVGNSATPSISDINNDGKLDLVAGEEEGNLNYFRNSGDSNGPLFTLDNDQLGGINTTVTPPYFEGQSAPFFFEFEGMKYVAIGSKSGEVFQYQVGSESEEWIQVEEGFDIYSSFNASPSGLSTKPVVINLNNDEIPEVITGLVTGGLEYFAGEGFLSTNFKESQKSLDFKIFPNPSEGQFRIEFDSKQGQFQKLIISGIDGRTVLQSTTNRESFDISRLVPGTYIVTIELSSGLASEILIKK
ncbi:T9SS type A sorting domain-containing protein [Cryomorphaceae bacterium 1068]|nr:T9SS type A sorting domain-containing protein [Cryomorphaceae bacterium 1068]